MKEKLEKGPEGVGEGDWVRVMDVISIINDITADLESMNWEFNICETQIEEMLK